MSRSREWIGGYQGLRVGRNGETLSKEYKFPAQDEYVLGNLLYGIVITVNNTVLYI